MNIIFHKDFFEAFKQLPGRAKPLPIQQICYFNHNPLAECFRMQAIYAPDMPKSNCYLINVGQNYRAAYHLADDETALFTHIFPAYEQPVVLPQELQT